MYTYDELCKISFNANIKNKMICTVGSLCTILENHNIEQLKDEDDIFDRLDGTQCANYSFAFEQIIADALYSDGYVEEKKKY
jgi:hypothetical protein